MDATLYPYPCTVCDAPNAGWAPGQICADCAEDFLQMAESATADEMRATRAESACYEATCSVCKERFTMYADDATERTLCTECLHWDEVARDAVFEADTLADKARRAAEHAAEMQRVAAMTREARAFYWAQVEAEDDDVQQALLAAD